MFYSGEVYTKVLHNDTTLVLKIIKGKDESDGICYSLHYKKDLNFLFSTRDPIEDLVEGQYNATLEDFLEFVMIGFKFVGNEYGTPTHLTDD